MNVRVTKSKNQSAIHSFQLNRRFNAIIGRHGTGKSTLLHAILIACGAYLLGIPEANKRHLWANEIMRKDFGTHLSIQTSTIVEAEDVNGPKKETRYLVR